MKGERANIPIFTGVLKLGYLRLILYENKNYKSFFSFLPFCSFCCSRHLLRQLHIPMKKLVSRGHIQ